MGILGHWVSSVMFCIFFVVFSLMANIISDIICQIKNVISSCLISMLYSCRAIKFRIELKASVESKNHISVSIDGEAIFFFLFWFGDCPFMTSEF